MASSVDGFGPAVRAADSSAPAAWIRSEQTGAWGTVGLLVPDRFPSILLAPAPDAEWPDWWPAYRGLFATIASVGARHTTTPDRGWFAVWDGHGFDTRTTKIARRDPTPDEATRLARADAREHARSDDLRRNAAVRSALSELPTFELPGRTYYILHGPVTAATELRDPSSTPTADRWHRPDLFWPADRRWFAVTDVDFWSVYVGGDPAFVDDIACAVPTATEAVAPSDLLIDEN